MQLDVFNVFDNLKLIAWNTTVSQNPVAGVDNLGLATRFNIPAYPLAFSGASPGGRTLRVAFGFRF